eukprot:13752342-Ditylum_brightwellii.AAC.2
MMSISNDVPCNIYCDNKSLVLTIQRPKATIKKKHNAINWHHICEEYIMGMHCMAKEALETNLSNM